MSTTVSHGFIQGSTHRVCEDYAISTHIRGCPLIIVSDGCSAAPDTDVGARVITHCAKLVMEGIIFDFVENNSQPKRSVESIGQTIRNFTVGAARAMNLDLDSCLATLMIGLVLGDTCHVYIFGDGVWFKTSLASELELTTITAKDEMPDYLLLGTHPTNRALDKPVIGHHWSFPVSDVAEFGLATDGVCAVKGKREEEVIKILAGAGPHLNYHIDEFMDKNPYLYDDIGIASISFA